MFLVENTLYLSEPNLQYSSTIILTLIFYIKMFEYDASTINYGYEDFEIQVHVESTVRI